MSPLETSETTLEPVKKSTKPRPQCHRTGGRGGQGFSFSLGVARLGLASLGVAQSPWSSGPLVLWSLVLWFFGPLVLVPWSPGSGPLVLWLSILWSLVAVFWKVKNTASYSFWSFRKDRTPAKYDICGV